MDPRVRELRRVSALTVAKLCERMLCKTLRAAFLGERKVARQGLLASGAQDVQHDDYSLESWVEVLDNVGDINFHGFTVRNALQNCMFITLDSPLEGSDLKSG